MRELGSLSSGSSFFTSSEPTNKFSRNAQERMTSVSSCDTSFTFARDLPPATENRSEKCPAHSVCYLRKYSIHCSECFAMF